jgi:hypothetical protein
MAYIAFGVLVAPEIERMDGEMIICCVSESASFASASVQILAQGNGNECQVVGQGPETCPDGGVVVLEA